MRKLFSRLGIILLFLGIGSVFSCIFDPYGVFHEQNQRDYIDLSTNMRYVKVCHLLNNPLKYDTLLFGSSRVGYIDVELLDVSKFGNCYNMTYSGGTPADHIEDLQFLIEKNVIPRQILLGFDVGSILTINQNTKANLLRRPYPYDGNFIGFYVDYLNPTLGLKALMNSDPKNLSIMMSDSVKDSLYSNGQGDLQFYRNPKYWLTVSEEEHAESLKTILKNQPLIPNESFEKTLQILFEIKQLCDENNIELTFFTTPHHVNHFAFYANKGLLTFFSDFVEKAEFINFLGVNNITTDPLNYIEIAHYNATAGDYVVKVLNNVPLTQELYDQCFGITVGKENVNTIVDILSNQAAEYLPKHIES